MIRAFQIAVVSDSRLQTQDPRPKTQEARLGSHALDFVSCILLSFCLMGCTGPEEEDPIWEKVKIGDLTPYSSGGQPQARLLKTINFDILIFEIPAENISKLDDIRSALRTNFSKPMRFNSPHAFNANSFSVCFGQIPMWNKVSELLNAAGGQKITEASLLLADGRAESIVVAGLDSPQTIFFTSTGGSREGAQIGPGILVLRVKADKIPGLRGACNVNACPVFSPPTLGGSIPQIAARVKLREFLFTSAAFGLRMNPGDFVFLGPEKYISDQTALGGLFFSKPEGSLFLGAAEHKVPEHKPAVRIFLLFCTGVND